MAWQQRATLLSCLLAASLNGASGLKAAKVWPFSSNKQAEQPDQPEVLTEAIAGKCRYEITGTDTRYDPPGDAYGKDEGAAKYPDYWHGAGMVNIKYAEKYGYDFRPVKVVSTPSNVSVPWNKIWFLRNRVQELLAQQGSGEEAPECQYLVYIDSDAWFRDFDTSLPTFLARLGDTYGVRPDTDLILSREQDVPGLLNGTDGTAATPWLNTGVMFVRVSEGSVQIMENVIKAGRAFSFERRNYGEEFSSMRYDPFQRWPAEQGVLTNLWNTSLEARFMMKWTKPAFWEALQKRLGFRPEQVAVVDMLEMNSPWGHLIQHMWSGEGGLLNTGARYDELETAFVKVGAPSADDRRQLHQNVWDHTQTYDWSDDVLVKCPENLRPPRPWWSS